MTQKEIRPAQSSKPEVHILRDFPEVNKIKFIFHLGIRGLDKGMFIPQGLTKISRGEQGYMIRRTNEVMAKGGNMNPEALEKQRPGITDTGIRRTPEKGLQWVKGASTVFQKLLDGKWKITDCQWEEIVTQQRLSTGHVQPNKNQVTLEVSKDSYKELKLKKETMIGLRRLLGITWQYLHIWYNKHNGEIVLSFTGKHPWKYLSPGWIIALPKEPST